jgi:hypothetical protein
VSQAKVASNFSLLNIWRSHPFITNTISKLLVDNRALCKVQERNWGYWAPVLENQKTGHEIKSQDE